MASLKSRHSDSWMPASVEDWGRHALGRPEQRWTPSPKLLIAGALVVGLGVLGVKYALPDLKRYLKIQSM